MSSNNYLEDNTLEEPYYDDGLLDGKTILGATALIAGGIAGYKSGLFKKGIHSLMTEVANRKPTTTDVFNDIKRWITNEIDTPEKSLFRSDIKNIFKNLTEGVTSDNVKFRYNAKDVYDDIKKVFKGESKIVENLGDIISHTNDDLVSLSSLRDSTSKGITLSNSNKLVQNYTHNTDLLRDIKMTNEAVSEYSDLYISSKEALRTKGFEELVKDRIQDAETAKKKIDRTGYRQATLGDLFRTEIDNNGNIRLYEKSNFNFSNRGSKEEESAKSLIEKMLNNNLFDEDGVEVLNSNGKNRKLYEKYADKINNIVLDNNIFTDEASKIIDLRRHRKSANEFARSLATEWKIPVVGFNPFKMVGFDKIGKRYNFIGSINENTVAPFLTGVKGNSMENTIANLKETKDHLKGIKENVTIINGNVYRVSDDGQGITKMNYKSKKKLVHIPEKMKFGLQSLTTNENNLRKMSGLSSKTFTDYTMEDGAFKYYKQKIAKFFDIGYQESSRVKDKIDSIQGYSNFDTVFESGISKIRPKPYKAMEEIEDSSYMLGKNVSREEGSTAFFVTNEATTIKDVVNSKFNASTVLDYFTQFGANFNKNYENVNSSTAKPFFFLERINQAIGNLGLGLSVESSSSTYELGKNLILKRFLPIYAGYKGLDYLNIIGENDTENGTVASTPKQKLMLAMAKTDIGFHEITSKIGLNKLATNISQITPGSDMLGELPVVGALNIDKSGDERVDYWENGYDAVRKGRYWSLNTTPFVGGKIQYYKPNALRSAMADAKYSDSLYGSRSERLLTAFDKDYYDKKNYNSRPYLLGGSAFENVPLVGPILSGTIGKVINGPQKMHKDYWVGDRPMTYSEVLEKEEKDRQINKARSENDFLMLAKVKMFGAESKEYSAKITNTDLSSMENIYSIDNSSKIHLPFTNKSSHSEQSSINAVYKTPSGTLSTVNFKDADKYNSASSGMWKINSGEYTPSQVKGMNTRFSLNNGYVISEQDIKEAKSRNLKNPYSLKSVFKDQYNNAMNVGGIYGFAVSGFGTGKLGAGENVVESSSYSRSFNKDFWDKEIGGAGGDISEIFRRFVQKRRTDVNYYNPVRNDQGEWMPGGDYFIDFKHGDPFGKVARGEERIAGEGYERLHNIDLDYLLKMQTGSSTLGKTKEEIVNHLLNRDSITDEGLQDIVDSGTEYHELVEDAWVKSGKAIDVEGEIKDEANGIVGYYDAKINDDTSVTGEAIVDIKTINDKGFKEVKKNKKPKDEHQRQVNWYLHHTNQENKGYIYYINRDNPNETYSVGFNYSEEMYNSTMNTLEEARNDIRTGIQEGTLSRSDLYKPIDRFRILADVAPYSKEFEALNSEMSNTKMSAEEKEEVKAIRERMANVKEKTRFYKYRFKYQDTSEEHGRIDNQIDSITYKIKGSDNPIKLAGVKAVTKDNPKYEEAMKFLDKHMSNNSRIKIVSSQDESDRRNNDTLKSVSATVYNDGMNINKELIKRGYAEEKTDDFSTAGVMARFNSIERIFGKAWESIAHFDSMANTKMLQVRTATEDYKRNQVYGKEFKEWTEPINDFLKPAIWKASERSLAFGMLSGALVGSAFGNTKYGKLMGGFVGLLTVGSAKAYTSASEIVTQHKYIPKEKREEREIDDYMDKLTFIKNRRLFEVYAKKAYIEDGVDVKEMIESNKLIGKSIKKKKNQLEEAKRQSKLNDTIDTSDFEDMGVDFDVEESGPLKSKTGVFKKTFNKIKRAFTRKPTDDMYKAINKEINSYTSNRKAFGTSLNALKAIEYYEASEKTMYGYDPGEPITNIIAALPKRDKKYFQDFLEAKKHEQKEILDLAPKYMKRALQSAYGMKVQDKENLSEYFKNHALPGEAWDGWRENYDLNAMKVKVIQSQGHDLASYDMWADDKKMADMYGRTAIPNISAKTNNKTVITKKLHSLLGGMGLSDIDMDIKFTKGASSVNLNIEENLNERYKEKIKERLGAM